MTGASIAGARTLFDSFNNPSPVAAHSGGGDVAFMTLAIAAGVLSPGDTLFGTVVWRKSGGTSLSPRYGWGFGNGAAPLTLGPVTGAGSADAENTMSFTITIRATGTEADYTSNVNRPSFAPVFHSGSIAGLNLAAALNLTYTHRLNAGAEGNYVASHSVILLKRR